MSNAKNTQTEKAAATETPVKKDGPMVYCGPTVKNTVKQYTVYHDSKAVPDAVNRFLDAVPMARGLLVPLDKFKILAWLLRTPRAARVFFCRSESGTELRRERTWHTSMAFMLPSREPVSWHP